MSFLRQHKACGTKLSKLLKKAKEINDFGFMLRGLQ